MLAATSHDVVDLVDEDAAELLGFAKVEQADLEVTDAGREITAADILASKELFARHAYERAPLARSGDLQRTGEDQLMREHALAAQLVRSD